MSARAASGTPWMLVAATLFAIAWGGNEFTPLLVMYRNEGMDPVVVDSLLFAYVLGIVPGLAVSGPLSDRIGRRPVTLPAPWIGILGSALLALGGDSPALLAAGRVLCGIALGIAMAAGGSWLKELSQAPYDTDSDSLAGARRQGLSLTSGFAIGAIVAGVLAEWAPANHVVPYLVHIALSVPIALLVARVPETNLRHSTETLAEEADAAADGIGALVRSPRFLWLVLPLAPWVFGAAATAYAIIPKLLAPVVTGAPIAFSGLLCLVCLGAGFFIQGFVRRLYSPGTILLVQIACGFIVVGMLLAALVAGELAHPGLAIAVGLLGAVVLGAGYGTTLQSCLLEVQRLADRRNLAALTAVFYTLAYIGFAFPMILAALATSLSYSVMLAFGAAVGLIYLLVVTARNHREGGIHVAH